MRAHGKVTFPNTLGWEFVKERFQEKKKENTISTKKKVGNQDLDHAIDQEKKHHNNVT